MPVLDRFSLVGKVALVTGGAGLYGRQIVRALAEAGAQTYTASRNQAALEDVAASLRDEGMQAHALEYDQSSEQSILALRDEIARRAGGVDVLVNNALQRPKKWGFSMSGQDFADSMQANATGIFLMCRAFGDAMAERNRGGSIINIASIHGMIAPDPVLYEGTDLTGFNPDYFFHKAGMIHLTRLLASYYGPKGGIRCNAVAPGGYGEQVHPVHLQRYNAKTCLGRRANDTDLMGVIVFLASDASLYVTGTNIPVDGGYTIM